MSDVRVAIAGGGTGGHISPALAVAEALGAAHPSADVLFFGSAQGLEAGLGTTGRFETVLLDSPRSGGGVFRLPKAGLRLARAVRRAIVEFERFRPVAVVGTGGYASVAPALAAKTLGLPLIILEQNAIPGRANRLLARLADVTHTQFAESVPLLPQRSRVEVTGNPVRRCTLAAAVRRRHRRMDMPFTLLVMGGSQGAHSINVAVAEALPRLAATMNDMRVFHCAGSRDEDFARTRLLSSGLAGRVWAYNDRMDDLYTQADIAVCRAGATSMAERAACGLPSILVPYPFARDRHQDANAAVLARAGAAEVIADAALNGATLADRILSLVADPVKLAQMGAATRALATPCAGEAVVASIERLAGIPSGNARAGGAVVGRLAQTLRTRAA
jgi:UDP-N-acetylglucosamine--N-acetylmuramyl-(pentapeptide) pyrophosphoryl-undecaprenol N-acetylglucosamine transferase